MNDSLADLVAGLLLDRDPAFIALVGVAVVALEATSTPHLAVFVVLSVGLTADLAEHDDDWARMALPTEAGA